MLRCEFQPPKHAARRAINGVAALFPVAQGGGRNAERHREFCGAISMSMQSKDRLDSLWCFYHNT